MKSGYPSIINIELTSRCNKKCWMCGRRKMEKEYPEMLSFGDIDFKLLEILEPQLPDNCLLQFHSNGEPLLYPRLGDAMRLFPRQIKSFDTNGMLLLPRAAELIDLVDTICISVFENDEESDNQYESVTNFVDIKGDRKPFMVYRLLGDVAKTKTKVIKKDLLNGGKEEESFIEERLEGKRERWYRLPGVVATRILHNPMGSFGYPKTVTVPEHGVCLDLLTHLTIDRYGDCYPCVRFNPYKLNYLGNIRVMKLEEIWNSALRQGLISCHARGDRNCSPLCEKCEFWGVPTGY